MHIYIGRPFPEILSYCCKLLHVLDVDWDKEE